MARRKRIDPFFISLKSFAETIEGAAEAYNQLFESFPSEDALELMNKIDYAESQGDGYVKDILDRLVTSFSTPFDREDLNDLTNAMDDVLDNIEGAAKRLDLFNIHAIRDEAKLMADLTLRGAKSLVEVIELLPDFDEGGEELRSKAHELSELEHEGDVIYQKALYRLFHEEVELEDNAARLEHITWLRLFDRMEYALDSYDTLAVIVRRIVIKNA